MPTDKQPKTVSRTIGGTAYTISRHDVQAAAARLRPLHEGDLANRELYVLIGSGLHYGPDLIAEVTSAPPIDGREAYDLLGRLGLQLFRWDWGNLKDTRHEPKPGAAS
ncbi:hypothetical protein ACFWIN_01395 [Streptomyces sp. NPDC127049]|uniref:hypothetical protein n=1 Tax=Streptomyces sp. NPDC127049 TaxID=3347118 RepID=UPI0036674815